MVSVEMSFHHADDGVQDFDITRELQVLPRAGEELLWTDEVVVDGEAEDRQRTYVVRTVEWAMNPDTPDEACIWIKLEFIGEG